MQIIPVLDLKGGLVVRGIAGRRELYKPVVSALCSTADPAEVACALREELGTGSMYLADLDGIASGTADPAICRELEEMGFRLMIDAGMRSLPQALDFAGKVKGDLIAALETLPSPGILEDLVGELGPRRVIFSLDLSAGRPLTGGAGWAEEVEEIADRAFSAGIERMILLDLAAVGSGEGPPHLETCLGWKERYPDLELITGGGVRNLDDLLVLKKAGVDGVLVASALHDGSLGRAEFEQLSQS
ncbi:MAG: HisA/HisF-related TIM barrel protein [Planctomycetota bacterium]